MMEFSNQQLLNGIKSGEIKAYEELYKRYYVYLCHIAEHIVKNSLDAEEIVSDVFVKIWDIREKINISVSIKTYLIKAVQNTSLNYLERNKLKNCLTDSLGESGSHLLGWDSDYPLGQLYENEIKDILFDSINNLPDSCRRIYMLSRDADLKNNEIAHRLGISVNTVKTQIRIALSRLRLSLKEYLMILLVILFL